MPSGRIYPGDDPYIRDLRPAAPVARQPLGSRPEPEGVNILDNHRRVGDAQRETYLSHLADLHARGYLPQEEFEVRQAAVQKAEVEYDLNRLIADTPGLVEPNRASLKRALRSPAATAAWFAAHKDNRVLAVIGLIAWLFASIAWATIPPAVLGFYATPQSGFAIAMVIFFIMTAIASVIAETVVLVSWLEM